MEGALGPAPCEGMHGVHCRRLAEVQKHMQVQRSLTRLWATLGWQRLLCSVKLL